jgi:hypothetical protein
MQFNKEEKIMKRETSWDRVDYLKKICAAFNAPKKQQQAWDVNEPIELPFDDGVQKAYPKVWTQKRIDLYEAGATSSLLKKTEVVAAPEVAIEAVIETPKKVKKTKEKKMGAALLKAISHVKSKI